MPSTEQVSCDIAVIGAGAIGLAVAARAASNAVTIVIEKNPKFGQETSSRNSEVIHSGIYYPKDSLKTQLCVRGRELLYDFCKESHVPFSKCGKFVVATRANEVDYLEKLDAHCKEIGVAHEWRTGSEVMKAEPLIQVERSLYFPETGIVDSHQFMQALENRVQNLGALLAYRHRVVSIQKDASGWVLEVDADGSALEIRAAKVVNTAGLGAAELSNRALGEKRYQHKFCRGRYFVLGSKYVKRFSHLVYPVPQKDGLGVHVTLDLAGCARLGPDVEWAEGVSYADADSLYECDWDAVRPHFVTAARAYLASVTASDLSPGLIGIRPKLFVDGVARPEFLIEDHSGFVHCLGIESPGLTSALAIAERVNQFL